MKKTLLLIALFAFLVTGFDEYEYTKVLTVRNLSGMPIAVNLIADEAEDSYYLALPEGSRKSPVVRDFDIVTEEYTVQIQYIESWDPVYGYECGTQTPFIMKVDRSLKLVIFPCNEPARATKEKIVRYPALNKRQLLLSRLKRPEK